MKKFSEGQKINKNAGTEIFSALHFIGALLPFV
jgi:hypothetical protein